MAPIFLGHVGPSLPFLSGALAATLSLHPANPTPGPEQAPGSRAQPSGCRRARRPDTRLYALVNLHGVSLRSDFNLGNIPVNNNI